MNDIDVVLNTSKNSNRVLFHFPCLETSGTSMVDAIRGLTITPSSAESTAAPTGYSVADSALSNPHSATCGGALSKRFTLTGDTFDPDTVKTNTKVVITGTTGLDGTYRITAKDSGGTWFDVGCGLSDESGGACTLTFSNGDRIDFDTENRTVAPIHETQESALAGSGIWPSSSGGKVTLVVAVGKVVGYTWNETGYTPAYDSTADGSSVNEMTSVKIPVGKTGTGTSMTERDAGVSLSFDNSAHLIVIGHNGGTEKSFLYKNINLTNSNTYLYTDESDISTGKTVVMALAHDGINDMVYAWVWDDSLNIILEESYASSDIIYSGGAISDSTGTVIQDTEWLFTGTKTRISGLALYGFAGYELDDRHIEEIPTACLQMLDDWTSGDMSRRVPYVNWGN